MSMLYASFDIWYSCLQVLKNAKMQKTKYFDRFCEDCDDYYKLSQDARNVRQNGDAVFTRENYETLSSVSLVTLCNLWSSLSILIKYTLST